MEAFRIQDTSDQFPVRKGVIHHEDCGGVHQSDSQVVNCSSGRSSQWSTDSRRKRQCLPTLWPRICRGWISEPSGIAIVDRYRVSRLRQAPLLLSAGIRYSFSGGVTEIAA